MQETPSVTRIFEEGVAWGFLQGACPKRQIICGWVSGSRQIMWGRAESLPPTYLP